MKIIWSKLKNYIQSHLMVKLSLLLNLSSDLSNKEIENAVLAFEKQNLF